MTYKFPDNYRSPLDLFETQLAIKELKDFFQSALAETLNLHRVTAPLFVLPQTGLNDNLNGIERPVSFDIPEQPGNIAEIVQSLAKWKRFALKKYGFMNGVGLYTDMNAIRRDEETDAIHSIYVDQWDWEKIITADIRNDSTLENTVRAIFLCCKETENLILGLNPRLGTPLLPDHITFIDSQELEDSYPGLSSPEREYEAVKKHGAIFVKRIGWPLKSGKTHDKRAPDYDDWNLNGDIIFYNPVLDCQFEISSMGIRVDSDSIQKQLDFANANDRREFDFQKALINNELPLTIGGGIGQSRLCMYFLRKAHIGEVQCSVWRSDTVAECAKLGIELL